jgi:hypothetical protein
MTVCTSEPRHVQSIRVAQQSAHARYRSCDLDAQLTLRRQLWSAVVRALNHSKLPYCILGAADDTPELAGSDMDFVVRPCDYIVVPQLLASAAAGAGARLVQAIEHETTATYFVIAKQQGADVAFLHPDCTTHYRRQRRLWITSDELLRGRRRASGVYFRPSPDVEFKYYLIKQVLKQTLSHAQWTKLVAFYQASPCPMEALSLWTRETAVQIEQSLLSEDRDGFREQLPRYNYEFTATVFRESALARGAGFIRDSARVATRMARPTGLFVQLSGGALGLRTELAWKLAKTLAPAFRRSSVVNPGNPAKVLRALIESTLLVSAEEVIPYRTPYGGVDIHWQPALTRRENFEHAVATILSHLSRRTMRRLELHSHQSQRFELDMLADSTVF